MQTNVHLCSPKRKNLQSPFLRERYRKRMTFPPRDKSRGFQPHGESVMNLSEIHTRRQPGRAVTGMAAVLLPFDMDGRIAEDAYANCLQETVVAGLTPAV